MTQTAAERPGAASADKNGLSPLQRTATTGSDLWNDACALDERMDEPVDAAYVEELSTRLEHFRRAYEPDGLRVDVRAKA